MTPTAPPPPPDTDADLDEATEIVRAELYRRAVHERDPEACMIWLTMYAGWNDGDD
jgi:hypothetical protein